jgi:hypothetical protein
LDHGSDSRSVLSIEVGINLSEKLSHHDYLLSQSSLPHQTDRTVPDRISEWQKLRILNNSIETASDTLVSPVANATNDFCPPESC